MHRFTNWIHTLVLIAGMVGLLALISEMLFGAGGLPWLLLFGAGVLVLVPRIQPQLLMRLYRARLLSPVELPHLYSMLRLLERRAEVLTAVQLYYIPSLTKNAFTVGYGDQAVIAISEGLLRSLTQRELFGVLAHELSHLKNHDLWLMSISDFLTRLTMLLALLGLLLLMLNLPMVLLGYVTFSWGAIMVLLLSPTVSRWMQMALSRTREYAADASAAILTGDPDGLAAALAKINPDGVRLWSRWGVTPPRDPNPSLLRSHPDTQQRIDRLMAMPHHHHVALLQEEWEGPSFTRRPQSYTVVLRSPRRHWSGIWY